MVDYLYNTGLMAGCDLVALLIIYTFVTRLINYQARLLAPLLRFWHRACPRKVHSQLHTYKSCCMWKCYIFQFFANSNNNMLYMLPLFSFQLVNLENVLRNWGDPTPRQWCIMVSILILFHNCMHTCGFQNLLLSRSQGWGTSAPPPEASADNYSNCPILAKFWVFLTNV